jgi:uroporphyrinogen III methyltransferase/synthase
VNNSDKPLAGKRVVVTRAPEQAAEFVAQLESYGAEVLLLPSIRIAPPENLAALDRAVVELESFDWVIFTSRNAVKFFASRFPLVGITRERMNQLTLAPKVAVIGASTHNEALSIGFLPDVEAHESRSEVLAAELSDQLRGKRVLLPRGDRADSSLPRALEAAGANVVEVIAYRTIRPESFDPAVVEAIRAGEVDAITLFSPSACETLLAEIGLETLSRHSSKIRIASIGPTTSNAVREGGLPVAIESPSASSAALCAVIAEFFRNRANRGTVAP